MAHLSLRKLFSPVAHTFARVEPRSRFHFACHLLPTPASHLPDLAHNERKIVLIFLNGLISHNATRLPTYPWRKTCSAM